MPIRLLTLDPGHFHAALVQKEMYPEVNRRVHVYAPPGPDLDAHLQRIAAFNSRGENPTAWELEVHAGLDFLERFAREKPGDVVVLAGKNDRKIEYIRAAIAAGLSVLADKPWIICAADLPQLQAALDDADRQGLVACDIMTERHEITSILQRELVNDAEVFGEIVPGTPDEPGVFMESVHYLKKTVAGSPLRRPPWFFDVRVQGEGLADVGTHLVDLVMWMLFPNQGVATGGIEILSAQRWPTMLSRDDFRAVTGVDDFPPSLAPRLDAGRLPYFCNNRVTYRLSSPLAPREDGRARSERTVFVTLNVLWDCEAAAGAGDTHLAVFRGSRSRVEVRQGAAENYRTELYVVPAAGEEFAVRAALEHRVAAWQATYPGVAWVERGAPERGAPDPRQAPGRGAPNLLQAPGRVFEPSGSRWQVTIPNGYREGHEAHFAQVTRRFLRWLQKQEPIPVWEKPNMLAKYHVTTQGVAAAQT